MAETVAALSEVGAGKHAGILRACFTNSDGIERVGSLAEYSELARERAFPEDSGYYALKPDVFDILQTYYANELEAWVAVEP